MVNILKPIKEKKGLIKIIEAFIAILIISGVMIFIYTTQIKKPDISEKIEKIQIIILEKIAEDGELRAAVLGGSSDDSSPDAINNRITINNTINDLIEKLSPGDYTFLFKICDLDDICGLDFSSKYYTENEIYVKERSISSTLNKYNPKKIRIFMWLKN